MTEYDDFPVADLVARAERLIQDGSTKVYFKATCPQCGARPTFAEPNTVYETMECCECGCVFPFTKGNYMVERRLR